MMLQPTYRMIKASAGTGKTYTLVQHFLHHVQKEGLRPSQVVAITFTKKAALELRTRIYEALKAQGCSGDVLSDVSRAPISNFHGLALQLLKEWSHLSGVFEGTVVLGEEGGDVELFKRACEKVFFECAETADDAEVLSGCFTLGDALYASLWEALSRAREDGALNDMSALMGFYNPDAVKAECHAKALAIRDRVQQLCVGLTPKSQEKAQLFLQCEVPLLNTDTVEWAAAWKRAAQHIDRRGGLKDVFSEDDKTFLKEGVDAVYAEELCQGLRGPMLRVLEALWRTYTDLKNQRHVLDFSDLIEKAVFLMRTQPWCMQWVRERYCAVLVDEAQDSNGLQRTFVRLLSGLEEVHNTSAQTRASLAVVGDWKQSIYTFRGAHPQSFFDFEEDITQMQGEHAQLHVSRRSSASLIKGINSLGEVLFGERYEPLKPLEDVAQQAPSLHWYDIVCAQEQKPHVVEAHAVAGVLKELFEEGYAPDECAVLMATSTHMETLAYVCGQYGIVCDVSSQGGLLQQPEVVDVLSLASWLVNPADRVALATVLRSGWVGLSDDGVWKIFYAKEGIDVVFNVWEGDLRVAESLLEQNDAVLMASFLKHVPWMRKALCWMRPDAWIEACVRCMGVYGVYGHTKDVQRRVGSVQALQEKALGYEGTAREWCLKHHALMLRGEYVPWKMRSEEGVKKVVVSTVHQSKGLQYKVVVLPYLWRKKPTMSGEVGYARTQGFVIKPRENGEVYQSVAWCKAEQYRSEMEHAEERRLCYVALTRAEEKVVCVNVKPPTLSYGFGALLSSCIPQAFENGCVCYETREVSCSLPSSVSLPENNFVDGSEKATTPREVQWVMPVTQWSRYLQCLRRGYFEHVLHMPSHVSASSFVSEVDMKKVGEVVHAVLSGYPRWGGDVSLHEYVYAHMQEQGADMEHPLWKQAFKDTLQTCENVLIPLCSQADAEQKGFEWPFYASYTEGFTKAVWVGQVDMFVKTSNVLTVVDYKYAKHTSDTMREDYALQLYMYAVALADAFQWEGDVEMLLVHVRSHGRAVRAVCNHAERTAFKTRMLLTAQAMGEARAAGQQLWKGLPQSACVQQQCPFLKNCFFEP